MPTLAFARLSPGVDFGAKDGPADLAFLIAAPAGGDATHLKLLTKLARALVKAGVHRRRCAPPSTRTRWSELVNDVGRRRPSPPPPPPRPPRRRRRGRRAGRGDRHRGRRRAAPRPPAAAAAWSR